MRFFIALIALAIFAVILSGCVQPQSTIPPISEQQLSLPNTTNNATACSGDTCLLTSNNTVNITEDINQSFPITTQLVENQSQVVSYNIVPIEGSGNESIDNASIVYEQYADGTNATVLMMEAGPVIYLQNPWTGVQVPCDMSTYDGYTITCNGQSYTIKSQ
jgi:hypothetical protein